MPCGHSITMVPADAAGMTLSSRAMSLDFTQGSGGPDK
jgi:hypothetical protein